MSVSAGRVLIMSRGDWNSTTEYNNLDLVRHNKVSWICKKTCIGVEPSDTQTSYWQAMAKDSEETPDMVGATESQNGTHGLVPAPQIGDEKKALLGDGTWGTVDAIYSFETEEAFNQAVANDEIPDGSKVIKEWDEEIVSIGIVSIDSAISPTSTNPIQNRTVFKGDYGLNSKTTTFGINDQQENTITEVDGNGYTRITTFMNDGSIEERIKNSSSVDIAIKTTVFNTDGSITETVS